MGGLRHVISHLPWQRDFADVIMLGMSIWGEHPALSRPM